MTEPHPKDVGRKPGRIEFVDPSGDPGAVVEYDHVDPHDGYVLAIKDGERAIYPWHRVHAIRRMEDL